MRPAIQMWRTIAIIALATLGGLARTAAQQPSSPGQTAVVRATVSHVANATALATPNLREQRPEPFPLESGDLLWSIPLSSLTATRERPIFAPTRQPRPTVMGPATSRMLAGQPPLALVGAIAGENDGVAIFRDGNSTGLIRLKTGESYSGWILQAVKPREAVLQNEQKKATLALPNPPAK